MSFNLSIILSIMHIPTILSMFMCHIWRGLTQCPHSTQAIAEPQQSLSEEEGKEEVGEQLKWGCVI